MSLPVSRLVRASINLSPLSAAPRSFGVLMIAGDSDVINGLERFRSYGSIEEVAADFGVSAPEYFAAQKYFSQVPQPNLLMIGRWLRVASSGENIGGILNALEKVISGWTSISSGGFHVSIDGSSQNLTGLDFSGVTSLNGVAGIIDAALTGASCVFDGNSFIIESDTTGTGVKASATVTLNTNPANADTLTVNGTAITFVSALTTGNQVLIGGSRNATSANLQAFLQASADTNIDDATYATDPSTGVTTVTYKTKGTAGNSFTLVKSSTHITLSGATLSGGAVASSVGYATAGSGTDISAKLKLTSGTSLSLIPGYDAESPVECAAALSDMSTEWYGLMFQASTQPNDSQNLAVMDFIEALDIKRIFGVTIVDSNALSALVSNDLGSMMMAAGYLRSFNQYSSKSAYAVASIFGRAFSVDYSQPNSTINLMYKQEPTVEAENLTTQQANVLQDKRINVYAAYVNETNIIQYGVMSGPMFIDERHDLDWFQDAVQTAAFNLLYTSTTKIPQTDSGANQIVNAISGVCEQAVSNGMVGPGTWNADGFGQLQRGQFLKSGYYIFAQPMALQSQADREQRKAPPITVAIKLAGAIQEIDVVIDVNR